MNEKKVSSLCHLRHWAQPWSGCAGADTRWRSIRDRRRRRASCCWSRVRSGIDGLITTLRDRIDAEVLEAGRGTLKGIAQIAVGVDNISRADANRCGIPFTNTADVLTDATAEFAFAILLAVSRKLWPSERLVRENRWEYLASVICRFWATR